MHANENQLGRWISYDKKQQAFIQTESATKLSGTVAYAQHSGVRNSPSLADDSLMPGIQQTANRMNDESRDSADVLQQDIDVKTNESSPTGRSAAGNDSEDLVMESQRETEGSPARHDNPTTVSWLEGEVLDQAKGPPNTRCGIPTRRRDYDTEVHDSEESNDRSKA